MSVDVFFRMKDHTYILHNDIVRRDAISRDEEQSLCIDFIQFSYFARRNKRQVLTQVRLDLSHGISYEIN